MTETPVAFEARHHIAAHYGRLALVAINFYIQTGNLAEQDAAYWYARYAAQAATYGLVDGEPINYNASVPVVR